MRVGELTHEECVEKMRGRRGREIDLKFNSTAEAEELEEADPRQTNLFVICALLHPSLVYSTHTGQTLTSCVSRHI